MAGYGKSTLPFKVRDEIQGDLLTMQARLIDIQRHLDEGKNDYAIGSLRNVTNLAYQAMEKVKMEVHPDLYPRRTPPNLV